MARLIVYGRSSFCPDMMRWNRWIASNPLEYIEFDIDADDTAWQKVTGWTGHESVPTLVIAPDDGFDPIEDPTPLPAGRSPRGYDRGVMLTEPNPGQVELFLDRHGIPYGDATGLKEAAITKEGRHREGGGLRSLFGF
jgi:glutaredoxin